MHSQAIPPKIKFFCGLGGISYGIKEVIFSQFVLFYYTQVIGLSPLLCGIALFLGALVDAISDPMVGFISDNSRLNGGRRHPFMACAIIPIALLIYGLFCPPQPLSEMGLFLWLIIFASGFRLATTFFYISFTALGAELSTDYDERTSISSYRSMLLWLGSSAVTIGAYMLIFTPSANYDNGLLDPENYHRFAILCAIFSSSSMLFSTLLMKQFKHTGSVAHPSKITLSLFIGLWTDFLKNKAS